MLNQLKIILLLICIVLLPACSYFEDEDIVKPAKLTTIPQKVQVNTAWENKTGDGTYDQYLKLTPAFVNGKIFTVSYRGILKAVNGKTGNDIWSVKTYQPITSGIAADDQYLFVGTSNGRLLAYRQSDGKFVWQAPVNNDILATPAVAAGKVIAKTVDGQLYAFNAATGEQLWTFEPQKQDLVLRGSSMPKIVGKYVINGLANGQLVALNLNDGQTLWQQTVAEPSGRFTTERMTDIDADPVVIDNVIYIATYQGKIAALSLNGRIMWQKSLSSYAGLTVNQDAIFAVDAMGHVWALDRHTGDKIWEQEGLNGRRLSTPAVFRNYLVVGDFEGYLHFLSLANGKFLARFRPDRSEIIVPPMPKGDGLYVMTKAGRLIKYN